jgi:hypothetical protein
VTGQDRHPKKEVEEALQYCEKKGWEVKKTVAGHKWGIVLCGEGCKVYVWATPKTRVTTRRRSARLRTSALTRRPKRRTAMSEYSFTLVIEGDDVESHLDELFEAGCEDATFGSVDGVHYAEFDREAKTLSRAISSALADVESVPGLVVRRVEPDDLVTASEIAERLGRTRESVRLLIAGKRGAGDFPAPVSHLRSRNRLWRWSDIVEWSDETSPAEVDRARLIAAFNAALELRTKEPDLPEEARPLVRS